MYSFTNDYSEGAHPKVLDLMLKSNLETNIGYGKDIHSYRARKLIKELIEDNEASIHFVSGGTQTNLLAISSFLRPHEAVISVDTGHIVGHETGAIEATGHKVISIPGQGGKLTPDGIRQALIENREEYTPKPRLVYISNTTELGTLYTKAELSSLYELCQKEDLILYLDGARLGSALTSKINDLTMKDIADLTDTFFIGGTKNGALLGEALVITRDDLKKDFRRLLKQRGAMLAKGFVMGIQFEALFKDDLFFELGDYANKMADQIIELLKKQGYTFLADPCSNQVFPILNNNLIEKLSKEFSFNIIDEIDDNNTAIRLVTSWATSQESVDALIEFFKTTNS